MLFGQINWARGLVHLFCTALFLYQLAKLLPSYFDPSLTNTVVSEMQLKDVDFPLNIKVCVRPGLNKTALKELGYLDKAMFIVGRSRFNGSLIGWGGHSNQSIGQRGSLRSAAEVVRMTKIERKGNLLLNFTINTNSEKTEEDLANNLVKKVTLQEVNVAHDCHILNLSKMGKELKGLRMVAMLFNQTNLRDDHPSSFLELRLEGKSVAAHRDIQDHYFFSSGDALKLDGYSNYRVKIKRNVYVKGKSVFIDGHQEKVVATIQTQILKATWHVMTSI